MLTLLRILCARWPLCWRCFHCGDVFTDAKDAETHFGRNEQRTPACRIDIARYREMERQQDAWMAEDTELHREINRLVAKHQSDLMREEEKGYARGLRDYQKVEAENARLRELNAAHVERIAELMGSKRA